MSGGEPASAPPLTIKRHLLDPTAAPKPAHRFFYSRVGSEIALDVGYFDLFDLLTLQSAPEGESAGKPREAVFNVTDRFVLSPESAYYLLETAKSLVADLRKNGILSPSIDEEKHSG